MTFEEWYNEIEGFSTRGARFEDWMSNSEDGGTGKDWLAAAYNAGFKHANELAGKKEAETAVEHDKKLNDVKLPSEGIPYPLRNAPPHIKYPTKDNPFTAWRSTSCRRCGVMEDRKHSDTTVVVWYNCKGKGVYYTEHLTDYHRGEYDTKQHICHVCEGTGLLSEIVVVKYEPYWQPKRWEKINE